MYKVGVIAGKFLPPHRGHLNAIIQASTKCEKLYVVVSDNKMVTAEICSNHNLRPMPLVLRATWLSQELSNFDHIVVKMLDESDMPSYPNGIVPWSKALLKLIPEKFDVMFGGEPEYEHTYVKQFPNVVYELYDTDRTLYSISATEIRNNFKDNWSFILGSARPNFTERVLITGTESCGKSTMTKYLGKIFSTSWAEEYGRYYADEYLGGNEDLYTPEDFIKIAQKHKEWEDHALKTSNKICFFDTDAVVTQYYAKLYLGYEIPELEKYIDNTRYDKIIMMSPTVKWVDDGTRFNGTDEKRKFLHTELCNMYNKYGFELTHIISDSYNKRLNDIINIIKE